MQDESTNTNILSDEFPKELPTAINVLTILTFIGCAFNLFSTIKNYFTDQSSLAKYDEAEAKISSAPAFVKKMFTPEIREMIIKSMENKIPLLVTSLIALGLCVYGAIEMRKLKKQGYIIWLVGELLPIISAAIFIPVFFQTYYAYFLIFSVVFILLYTAQRKYLTD